jgi:hypothetical protein
LKNAVWFALDYPEIKVEIVIDYGLTDIVAQRFDAGVRSGEQVAKDMIAVRIGPDKRMAVVGAAPYFKNRREPKKPRDLIGHNCIALRLPHGGLYAWEFENGGRELRVRVEDQLVFNSDVQMLNAALAGLGLAYLPEGMALPYLARDRLKRVLKDWRASRGLPKLPRPLPAGTRSSLCAELAGVFGRPGLMLSGDTAVGRRKELVKTFQEYERVPFCVLSLKAGGSGLTLTAASRVAHFDRWWIPAVENQATDRAFRVGQKRTRSCTNSSAVAQSTSESTP